MPLQKICGVALILLGLGEAFFAERIFNFSIQLGGARIMQFDRWPAWMTPTWIWMMRIIGILIVIVGFILISKSK